MQIGKCFLIVAVASILSVFVTAAVAYHVILDREGGWGELQRIENLYYWKGLAACSKK